MNRMIRLDLLLIKANMSIVRYDTEMKLSSITNRKIGQKLTSETRACKKRSVSDDNIEQSNVSSIGRIDENQL